MKSILQTLYDGQVYPCEAIKPNDTKYKELHSKISTERHYFKQKLSEQDGIRFDEMEELYLGATRIDMFASFSYGMKLGLLLALELLKEDEVS